MFSAPPPQNAPIHCEESLPMRPSWVYRKYCGIINTEVGRSTVLMMKPNMNFLPANLCRASGKAQIHAVNGAKMPLMNTTCKVFKMLRQKLQTTA